jgi:hypothetical protein
MARKLTELEKSILLIFLVGTKGDKEKYLDESFIVSKFSISRKKIARNSLKKLVEDRLLSKDSKEEKYKLTDNGFERSKVLLSQGVRSIKI